LYLYKPGQLLKFSNHHEVAVYESIQKCESLRQIVPKYYGVIEVPKKSVEGHTITKRTIKPGHYRDSGDKCVFVNLEDLTFPFNFPQVADLKLGKISYDETVTELEKQEYLDRAVRNGMAVYGARFDGVNVTDFDSGKKILLHKRDFWGNTLPNNFLAYLFPTLFSQCTDEIDKMDFLHHSNRREFVKKIVLLFIEKLKVLESVITDHLHSFNFLQSSVLLIYEGDMTKEPHVDARLIDFDRAHYRQSCGMMTRPIIDKDIGDVGAAVGVKSLVEILTQIYQFL